LNLQLRLDIAGEPAFVYSFRFAKFLRELRMLKRAAALFIICGSIATWMACGSTSSHFVYAAIPAANQILGYREDPNSGVLTPLAGSPFATGASSAPQALVIHPSKKFLYVVNSQEGDISLFTIASTGAITEVTPRTKTGGTTPMLLTIDSTGGFLYVAEAGSQDIAVFSIDSGSGALTPVGSPVPVGIIPISMKLSGNFLFLGGQGSPAGLIEVFSVNAGALSPVGALSTDGANPYGLAIDSTGTHLYAANFGSDSIAEFTIGSNGALTTVDVSEFGATLSAPFAMLVDPSGKFLYVANDASSGTLVTYAIASDGSLTVITGSPFGTGSQPNSLAADPSGKYLLVGNQSGASIQVFSMKSDGTLSNVATYSAGNTPTSIAVLD
jgi:6-phosphogluconolactonase (cycloisomerase 2 family)